MVNRTFPARHICARASSTPLPDGFSGTCRRKVGEPTWADRHNDQATATETSRLIEHYHCQPLEETRRCREHVYKVVEIVGSSEESVGEAIDRAIEKAALTLRNIGWFEVEQVRGHIENGQGGALSGDAEAGIPPGRGVSPQRLPVGT